MSKEKEVILNVLKLYKEMSCLWNKKPKDYKNKNSRNNAYRVLLEIYKQYDEKATVKTLTKKIQNLRTNYFKELKKVKESNRTGVGTEDIYIPSLWYFDSLHFLGESIEPCRLTRDPLESIQTEKVSPSSSDAEESYRRIETCNISPQKKKRLMKTNHLQEQKSIVEIAEKLLQVKDEEWEVLGKSIGLQLRDLNKKQLTITQKIISDAIYYAKIGLLTENSFIALDPSHSLPHHASSSSYSTLYNNQGSVYSYHRPSSTHPSQSPQSVSSSSPKFYINSETPSPHPSPSPQHHMQSFQPAPSPPI